MYLRKRFLQNFIIFQRCLTHKFIFPKVQVGYPSYNCEFIINRKHIKVNIFSIKIVRTQFLLRKIFVSNFIIFRHHLTHKIIFFVLLFVLSTDIFYLHFQLTSFHREEKRKEHGFSYPPFNSERMCQRFLQGESLETRMNLQQNFMFFDLVVKAFFIFLVFLSQFNLLSLLLLNLSSFL